MAVFRACLIVLLSVGFTSCLGSAGSLQTEDPAPTPPDPLEQLPRVEEDGGAGPGPDGGAPEDGGAALDAGGGGDAGLPEDGGAPDGGPVDAGRGGDGGAPTDAGLPPPDAGLPPDAGPVGTCIAPSVLPPALSTDPPTSQSTCTFMDWRLEPDGYYFISQFGMDTDPTTWGRGTSCGGLISHYTTWCCQHDRHQGKCIDGQTPQFLTCARSDPRVPKPPWVKGTVDYVSSTALSRVANYYFDSQGNLKPYNPASPFPWPEYFYVAGAQRFNCGSLLRMTNTENGRCIVVYVEDGGPGSAYEKAGYAGRRIVDSSPAVVRYLQPSRVGWNKPSMLYVEWGLPGDRPGAPCTPCQSTAVRRGSEAQRTSFDINHYDAPNCRATVGP